MLKIAFKSTNIIWSVILLVFIIIAVTMAFLIALLRLEVNNQYNDLQIMAKTKAELLSNLIEKNKSDKEEAVLKIIEYIKANGSLFNFALSGDTIIAHKNKSGFNLIYSSRLDDLSLSNSELLNNYQEEHYFFSLFFKKSFALFSNDYIEKTVLFSFSDIKNSDLAVICKKDLNEMLLPITLVAIKSLVVQSVLLIIGIFLMLFVNFKSLVKKLKTTTNELKDTYKQLEEIKNTQSQLSAMKTSLEEALDVSRFGFWIYDIKNNTSIRSIMHDKIFGYESIAPDWTLETFLSHVCKEDRNLVKESFKFSDPKSTELDFTCRITKTDGEKRYVWIRGLKKENEGQITGIIRDLTARKKLEKEFEDMRQNLDNIVEERIARLNAERNN